MQLARSVTLVATRQFTASLLLPSQPGRSSAARFLSQVQVQ